MTSILLGVFPRFIIARFLYCSNDAERLFKYLIEKILALLEFVFRLNISLILVKFDSRKKKVCYLIKVITRKWKLLELLWFKFKMLHT